MTMKNQLFTRLCRKDALAEAWTTVKSRNSAGGIDGVTIKDFDEKSEKYLSEILTELKSGRWSPRPYLGISIPKKNNERRQLGLLSVKDKIVQTAIKNIVEPKFERLFYSNSYGYRPNKGHNKAIRRTFDECKNKKRKYVLKLDIDNYFDSIDHEILTPRLHALISDEEVVRLIMLCIKMGRVGKNMKWQEITKGVPQGGVISPLISNFYLHPFDQFVLTQPCQYVRYADDFVIICDTKEDAEKILEKATLFLTERLHLSLNPPMIIDLNDGFDFLGVHISKKGFSLSDAKKEKIRNKINQFDFTAEGFSPTSAKAWKGLHNYYASLLPQEVLGQIDAMLIERLTHLILRNINLIPSRAILSRILGEMEFLSSDNQKGRKTILKKLLSVYDENKSKGKAKVTDTQNKKIIEKRKKEYQKREGESKELVVSTFGSFIGISQKGITVKQQGKLIYQKPIGALSHITIQGQGISLSSNLIEYCATNKISIDFFSSSGVHTGSVLSTKYIENTLWGQQSNCGQHRRNLLAQCIIKAKLRNQLNLIKYFHKYHKNTNTFLSECFGQMKDFYNAFDQFVKSHQTDKEDFLLQLVSFEAQGAMRYWGYIRELLSDDKKQFEKREHRGAKDLVNCMLNYGYAILYSRVWQALLRAKLNPFDSIIHVRQSGKPTFVYDVVEIFRAQVVDRVVISLVQKGHTLEVKDGLLEEATKRLLSKSILERINRYEDYRGEEQTMEDIINRQAKEIALYVSDESRVYRPYVSKW